MRSTRVSKRVPRFLEIENSSTSNRVRRTVGSLIALEQPPIESQRNQIGTRNRISPRLIVHAASAAAARFLESDFESRSGRDFATEISNAIYAPTGITFRCRTAIPWPGYVSESVFPSGLRKLSTLGGVAIFCTGKKPFERALGQETG